MNVRRIPLEAALPLLAAMRADGLDVIPGRGVWIGAGDPLEGVARVFESAGVAALDDVWVRPQSRRRGVATALIDAAAAMAAPLWLICDEPDVAFYERRGFVRVEPERFPVSLAAHYAAKREWPAAPDHAHVAMRRG